MEIEEAIRILEQENQILLFDPITGETGPLWLENQQTQDCYNAHLLAISALEGKIKNKKCSDVRTQKKIQMRLVDSIRKGEQMMMKFIQLLTGWNDDM